MFPWQLFQLDRHPGCAALPYAGTGHLNWALAPYMDMTHGTASWKVHQHFGGVSQGGGSLGNRTLPASLTNGQAGPLVLLV